MRESIDCFSICLETKKEKKRKRERREKAFSSNENIRLKVLSTAIIQTDAFHQRFKANWKRCKNSLIQEFLFISRLFNANSVLIKLFARLSIHFIEISDLGHYIVKGLKEKKAQHMELRRNRTHELVSFTSCAQPLCCNRYLNSLSEPLRTSNACLRNWPKDSV